MRPSHPIFRELDASREGQGSNPNSSMIICKGWKFILITGTCIISLHGFKFSVEP